MDEATVGSLLAAVMRQAGVTEVRVTDEDMVRTDAVVMRYRDEMTDITVFRLRTPADVIDAEEVPMPAHAIGSGA